jgi:hypothetical protein
VRVIALSVRWNERLKKGFAERLAMFFSFSPDAVLRVFEGRWTSGESRLSPLCLRTSLVQTSLIQTAFDNALLCALAPCGFIKSVLHGSRPLPSQP